MPPRRASPGGFADGALQRLRRTRVDIRSAYPFPAEETLNMLRRSVKGATLLTPD